jgi:hypothetical protein
VSDADPPPPPPPNLTPPPPPDLNPPPGLVGYTGGAGRGAQILRLRNFILIALALLVVVGIYQFAVTPNLINTSKDFLAGRITEDAYKDDISTGAASLLTQLPSIATVVLSMIWLYNLIRAHVEFGRRGTWGPGWAIGGWFLPPIVLYVIPMLVLRETWKASDPDVAPGDERWKQSSVHPVLWVWWVLYGLAPAVFVVTSLTGGLRSQFGNVGTEATRDVAKSIVDGQTLIYVQAAVNMLAVFAWAAVVHLWTARQLRFEQRGAAFA